MSAAILGYFETKKNRLLAMTIITAFAGGLVVKNQ